VKREGRREKREGKGKECENACGRG